MDKKHLLLYIFGSVCVLIPLLIVYLHFYNSVTVYDRRPKLLIDQDGGADDAMAIFMALLYEKYYNGPEVVALTTTSGNVYEDQVYVNVQRILDVADRRDVPIYRGANSSLIGDIEIHDHYFGYDGLGDNDDVKFQVITARPEHAVSALIELSKTYEDRLTVIALGPLTNIALAIRLDPGFIQRLSHIYVGAGNIYGEENQEAEYNAMMDVESYRVVVDNSSPEKVTVAPFSQVGSSLNITKEWRLEVLGSIPTDIMRAQNSFERVSLASSTEWKELDPAVMAMVLDQNVINETKYSDNSIILCGEERGINTNNFTYSSPNVRLIYSARKEEYKQLLIEVFSAELDDT